MAQGMQGYLEQQPITVTLPSNTPNVLVENKSSWFKVEQQPPIEVAVQNWEVGIAEIIIENNYANDLTAENIGNIYVYTDIIRPQRVGNQWAQLLRIVPVASKKNASDVHFIYPKPQYKDLAIGHISSIEARLTMANGVLVPFADNAHVIIVLHFRPKRTWYGGSH
jgi:hypothetical protein